MRSQEGLHRRERWMSNGTPPPGQQQPPPPPPPEEDIEPDNAVELSAVLDRKVSHAQIDAWVQDHEANLPERPDDWSRMTRTQKRAWVQTNYNFAAPDPGDPPDEDYPEDEDDPEDEDEDDGA